MTRPIPLVVLVLAAAVGGCTKTGPQESVVGTLAPTVAATENQLWRASTDGMFVKIVVVNVTANARTDVSWHDVLLNVTGAPLAPSSAYERRAGNDSLGAMDEYRLSGGDSLVLELHYRANATAEPASGIYDFSSAPIEFALPPARS